MTRGNQSSRLTGRIGWLPATLLALVALGLILVPIAFLTPDRIHAAQAAEPIDTGALRLIDDQARITLGAFRLNRATNTYLGTATITNISAERLAAPLYLVVASVSPAGASVVGADGLTTDGKPYYDLTTFMPYGVLAPAAVTETLTLQMKSPSAAPIQLGLHLYAWAPSYNRPPTANAGPDQTAPVGHAITLDGSGSTDPEGSLLQFDWSFLSRPAGSTAVLSGPTLVNPSFTIDRFGDYRIQLIVSDGITESPADSVRVSTLNSPPVADAGPDQSARVGDTVTLDGSRSSDRDGQPLTYRWSLLAAPAGSTATLTGPDPVTRTLSLDRAGTYRVQLIVNDGIIDSAPATVAITTQNAAPVANAGPDQSGFVGDPIHLSGSASTDVDGDPLTYLWSLINRPADSTAALSDTRAVAPSFALDWPGTYVAQLIVNDGALDSAPTPSPSAPRTPARSPTPAPTGPPSSVTPSSSTAPGPPTPTRTNSPTPGHCSADPPAAPRP